MTRPSSPLLSAARWTTLLLAASACAPSNPYGENPQITNHVDDWRDEVMYQLITDRFANGERDNDFNVTRDPTDLARHHGGDWQGIIDEVDYLSDLGVTAIWISPVVLNVEEDAGVAGYHGYWTQDFERTNPHFGDIARLRELVDVMHQHDIKVIVDIVANHVGQLFYYDINQNGQPDIQVWYSADGTELDPSTHPLPLKAVRTYERSEDGAALVLRFNFTSTSAVCCGTRYSRDVSRDLAEV